MYYIMNLNVHLFVSMGEKMIFHFTFFVNMTQDLMNFSQPHTRILHELMNKNYSKVPLFIQLCEQTLLEELLSACNLEIIKQLIYILNNFATLFPFNPELYLQIITILKKVLQKLAFSQLGEEFIQNNKTHNELWMCIISIFVNSTNNKAIILEVFNIFIILIDNFGMFQKINEYNVLTNVLELLGSIEEAYPYIIQFYYTIFIILKRNNQHLIIDDELLKFFVYIFQNYNDKVLIHMFNIVNIIEYQKVFIDILDYNFVIEKIYYDDESLANSALAFAISAYPIHLLYKDIAFEKFCHRNIVLWNVFKIFIDNGVEVSDEQELWMLKILIDLRYLEKLDMIEDIPY